MHRTAIVVIVICMSLLVMLYYVPPQIMPSGEAAMQAPDFTWQALGGSAHALSEFAGKPVIIHFWAAWCGPCREEFPLLLRQAARHPHIIFLTISGDDNQLKVESFMRQAQQASHSKKSANVMYAIDPDKKIIFDTFQTTMFPETIVLDSGHHMRQKFSGPVTWESKEIESILEKLH